MSKRIREPFGKAGLTVAILALVMALVGGAYAAENSGDSTTASAKNNRKGGGNVNNLIKRESRKFSKRFSLAFSKRFPGPIGPQGFPGLPGAPGSDGDDGDDGDDGSDGSDGTNGKSVETGNATLAECSEGGATVQVAGEAATKKKVCNGEDGEDGEDGVIQPGDPIGTAHALPANATLTGGWSLGNVTTAMVPPQSLSGIFVPISFPVPLPAVLDENHVHFIEPGGDEVIINGAGERELVGPTADCSGDASQPTAAAGHLCIYAGFLASNTSSASNAIGSLTQQGAPGPVAFGGGGIGASRTGAVMSFPSLPGFLQSGSLAWGAWAVTAPAAG